MKPKIIGIIASVAIVTDLLWIFLMVSMEGDAPVFNSITERIGFVESKAMLYRISYINAAFLTIVGTVFMTSLYLHAKKKSEFWATVAFVFVPIYGSLNLFAYLSQVIVVPPLLDFYHILESKEIAATLLAITLHNWPGSIIESLNGLAYAVLSIPSIIYPILVMRKPKILALGGVMLILSGILAMIAFTGTLFFTRYFTSISVVGGILATLADFPIAYHFLFEKTPVQ